jgi:signal transduction histidine kinase
MRDAAPILSPILMRGSRPSAEAAPDEREARPRRAALGGRVALAQFTLSSLALLIVLATIGAVALRHLATNEALHDATVLTEAVSRGAVQGAISPGVLAGDPAAVDTMDTLMRNRVLGREIVRIKVWTPDGRVLYSDARQLVGHTFPLSEDSLEALAENESFAEVTDLSRSENRLERNHEARLVEVYVPLEVDGRRVLVEAYHRADNIDAGAERIWGSFLPVLLAVLVMLGLAQLPLAAFLARRVRVEEHEREQMAREADAALEGERRRIAAELHDGVVQDLAGVAYDLKATADRLGPPAGEEDRDLQLVLRRGATVSRESMRALRALLVDLYPAGRRPRDLGAAVGALAAPLRERGIDVSVDVRLDGGVPLDTSELLYRAAQEALRNVTRHAAARTVDIALVADGPEVELTVHDDGRGMTAEDLDARHAAGHMGLSLLADGVAARGGALSIASEPGSGTRVRVVLPRE